MAYAEFNPSKDIGDMTSKTIVVTGGKFTRPPSSDTCTAGLGEETIKQLASHGQPRIFFTGRNTKSAEATVKAAIAVNNKLNVTFIQCDLTDLNSVAVASDRIVKETGNTGVDLVFCNAGIMATPAALSKDGYEVQFATNHIGHALLVKKLLPALQKASPRDARVIFSSSLGFQFASNIEFDTLRTTQEAIVLGAFRRYGQSKLANILYPAELARRYPEITWVSIHPGVIKTSLMSGLSTFNRYFVEATTFWKQESVDSGVKNQLWAASVEKSELENGAFYEPVGKPGVKTAASKNDQLAKNLYIWTEEAIAGF